MNVENHQRCLLWNRKSETPKDKLSKWKKVIELAFEA